MARTGLENVALTLVSIYVAFIGMECAASAFGVGTFLPFTPDLGVAHSGSDAFTRLVAGIALAGGGSFAAINFMPGPRSSA